MADSSQDRQLPATPRRIQKAREEGQVARSRDLAHLAVLGGGVALLVVAAPDLSRWLAGQLGSGLRFDATVLANPQGAQEWLAARVWPALWLVLPLGVLALVMALAAGVLAGGWNFSWKALEPKFEKISPIAGVQRLFSLHQLSETLKACLLVLVLGVVAAFVLHGQLEQHRGLLTLPLPAALAEGGALLKSGLLLLTGVLALFALVDVPLQRQLLLRRLRMSVQEMKQEFREAEGSPEIKQRLRQRMRELSNRRMLAQVPLADLVVMNPTHYAVALRYDDTNMAAPRVVAKGADLVAMRIRDLARDNRVPVLQAPALARALYTHAELDREVPARLFAAVAQVLAWVYGLRAAIAAGRAHAVEPPVPEVPADLDPHAPQTSAAGTPRTEPEL